LGVQTNTAAVKLGQQPIGRRERRAVSMRGFAERADGSSVAVVLLDLSYDGCGIETSVELQAGETLKLAVLRHGIIAARVCWFSDGKAGLVFEPEEPASDERQPRAEERARVRAEAMLRRLGGFNYQVHIFDVSPDGCKAELVETPRIGEHLLIKFDGLEALDSEVCWVEGMSAGLKFVKPMHRAVFDLLVQRLR
jgi:transposase